MRVVFTSNHYLPILGGSIVVLDRWSQALCELGHEVSILTNTPGEGFEDANAWSKASTRIIRVCRFHKRNEAMKVLRTADRVIMIEMSLKWLTLIFAAGKRPIATHHTHLIPPDGVMRPYRWLQYIAGLMIPAVGCSSMIARLWGPHVGVVPNPYNEKIFRFLNIKRDIDFIFVGRFISEKGIDVFLDSIRSLSAYFNNTNSRLPIIALAGDGCDKRTISKKLTEMGEYCQIAHFGSILPKDLSVLYNRSKVVVIPSVWQEPFGLVGLEAIACGCKVVSSDQPGLREATLGLAKYCKTGAQAEFAHMMALLVNEDTNDQSEYRVIINSKINKYRMEQSALMLLDKSKKYWNNDSS